MFACPQGLQAVAQGGRPGQYKNGLMVQRGANIGLNRPSYVGTMLQVEPMHPV
jgi:hypothetical protein